MLGGWDALGTALLFVVWPGLTLASAYAIQRAFRFYRSMKHAAPGRLVLLTVIGWVLTLAGVALVSTFFLRQAPIAARPIVLPVFVVWAGAMVTVVWVVHRWGKEAETLDAYYGELERVERMKSSFINHIAHEFNTPMTPIRMLMRMLQQQQLGPLTDHQSGALERIDRNLDRLGALVDQVMLASRLQAGRVALDMTQLPLRPVLERVAAQVEGTVVEDGGDVAVAADENHLGYALTAVAAEAVRRADGPVHVTVEQRNGTCIHFRYTGRPMGLRDLHAFSDPETLEQIDGIGVSLFNADGLLRLHSGRIEPSPDGVTVRLPTPASPPGGASPVVVQDGVGYAPSS